LIDDAWEIAKCLYFLELLQDVQTTGKDKLKPKIVELKEPVPVSWIFAARQVGPQSVSSQDFNGLRKRLHITTLKNSQV
jgi:hypothetical protein